MAGSVRYVIRIRIRGELGPALAGIFEDLVVTPSGDGTTVIEGELADQSALHGLLARIRDLGMSLVSVESGVAPSDAFQIGD